MDFRQSYYVILFKLVSVWFKTLEKIKLQVYYTDYFYYIDSVRSTEIAHNTDTIRLKSKYRSCHS